MRKIFTFLCAALMSVGMCWALSPKSGDTWDSSTGTLTVTSNPGNNAYYNQSEILHVIISDGVTSIGQNAFGICTNMQSLTFNTTGSMEFATNAFMYCTSLASVTLPEGLTSIPDNCFYCCISLTSVTLPASLESIGLSAFYYCSSLESVTVNATTPPTLGNNVFANTADALTVYVPAESVATYKENWSAYEDKIVAIPAPEPQGEEITPSVDPQNPTIYYSTFFDSAVKYQLPEGVEAYVATISENALLLTKIAVAGQTIPADNAVILKSTVAPFTLTPSEAEAVTFSATNSLQGTDVAIATPANCYVLGGADGVVGFYQYGGTNLNPHKAYVVFSGSNQAPRRMPFIFDAATGVENVQGNVQSTKVLRDGQLIIIRNGVEYNVNGMMAK